MHPEEIVNSIKKEIRREFKRLADERRAVFKRFPLLFALLVSVGAVATFSGLSRLIEQVEWLNRNPWVLLGFGITMLVLTGTLYKKLR